MQKTELRPKPTETVPEFSETSRRFRGGRALGLLIGTVVLFGAIALVSDTFLKPYTMFIIARQIAFSILIALSQAVCLVVGGMNLSVGAIGSMATVILGLCFQELKLNAWLAVPITLIFGVVSGAINGLIITRLKINSFIVTLSLMFVYMGLRSGISLHHSAGFRIHRAERDFWSFLGFCTCMRNLAGHRLHVFLHGFRSTHARYGRQ